MWIKNSIIRRKNECHFLTKDPEPSLPWRTLNWVNDSFQLLLLDLKKWFAELISAHKEGLISVVYNAHLRQRYDILKRSVEFMSLYIGWHTFYEKIAIVQQWFASSSRLFKRINWGWSAQAYCQLSIKIYYSSSINSKT